MTIGNLPQLIHYRREPDSLEGVAIQVRDPLVWLVFRYRRDDQGVLGWHLESRAVKSPHG